MHAAHSDAGRHVLEDEAGMHTAHAGGSQDGSVYEDGTEGSKSHDAGNRFAQDMAPIALTLEAPGHCLPTAIRSSGDKA